jgi:trigger factor
MQITETLSEGLKREYRVVVPAADLEAKVNDRLAELKERVHLNGFRPGKVPVAHLRRLYGRAVMAEAIELAVREANEKIITEHGFKLARDPEVNLPTAEGEVEQMIAGKSDLAYTVALEILPRIELADFKAIKLEKPVADVTEEEVDQTIAKLAESNRPYLPKDGGAASGDRVTVSYVGKVDGAPFDGGQADDHVVQIGSGAYLPGFEEQLIGIKSGESRQVHIKMPANHPVASLADKDAVFEVTAKSVEAPGEVTVDDAFAQSLGLESLAKLRDMVRERLQQEHALISRQRVKRALLDELISCISSPCRPPWLRTNSIMSGKRSRTSSRRSGGPLQTRAPPRRRRGRSTGPSPNDGCVWAWFWPRSASATGSR